MYPNNSSKVWHLILTCRCFHVQDGSARVWSHKMHKNRLPETYNSRVAPCWSICWSAFCELMPQVQKLMLLIIHGQYVNVVQQAFSLDSGTTLHLAIPTLETLYKAWSSCAAQVKCKWFAPALKATAQKLDGYYEKTTESNCTSWLCVHFICLAA